MMRKDLIRSSLTVLVLTVVLGLAYPLAMTGIARVAFPDKADGSLVERGGEVVGSTLLGRAWKGDGYFQPRPSVTGSSATVTFFANRGPNQRATRDLTRQHLAAYVARESRYVPGGLTPARVPVDAATFSASGVDPHISTANAALQAHRVAAVRRLPLTRVRQLISDATDGRGLGVFGEPGVNTTKINLALDQVASR